MVVVVLDASRPADGMTAVAASAHVLQPFKTVIGQGTVVKLEVQVFLVRRAGDVFVLLRRTTWRLGPPKVLRGWCA